MNPPAVPRHRRWPRRVAIALSLLLIALLAVVAAAFWRPARYRPASIDFARLDDDQRALVNLLDHIGAELNAGRPVAFELSAEQINRWIAARGEIWPDASVPLDPLDRPVVWFTRGGWVGAAAEARWGGWRAIPSVQAAIECDGSCVRLRPMRVAVGAAPVPWSWLRPAVEPLLRGGGGRVRLTADGALEAPCDWVWPNGKRPMRIARIEVAGGRVRVELVPR